MGGRIVGLEPSQSCRVVPDPPHTYNGGSLYGPHDDIPAMLHSPPRAAFLRVVLALPILAFHAACASSSWTESGPPATTLAPEKSDGLAVGEAARFSEFFLGQAVELAPGVGFDDFGQPVQDSRKMVYTGRLAVEVPQPQVAMERLLQAVAAMGGYLSARNDNRLTVRVPAARFQELVDDVREYGRVLHQSMQAQDVTKQHMDLTIRLENAVKARDRLLALLEKATEVEDILAIEKELTRLTGEIESMTGELKYLSDQVALATLEVAFQAVATARPERGRRPSRFWWINNVGAENVRRLF